METPAQRCARLVTALEDLAAQEAACVSTGDFDAIADLQRRAGAIVTRLTEGGPAVADQAIRRRLAEVVELRTRTAAELQVRMDATQQEIDSLQVSQRSVAKVAPVYGRKAAPRSQLSVVG